MRCRCLLVMICAMGFGALQATETSENAVLNHSVMDQFRAVYAEKQSWTANQQKIDGALLLACKQSLKMPVDEIAAKALVADPIVDARGQVKVRFTGLIDARLREVVLALGGSSLHAYPQFDTLLATVPLKNLLQLASLEGVRHIGPESGGTINRINSSEGNVAHRVDLGRNAFGVDGSGVIVGVLSNGVDSLAEVQASGDLPDDVRVLPDQAGFGDAGTAMLEVVHDLAPGAELIFSTAFPDQATMAANIRALADAGCDIIVDDVGFFAEPVFQDGFIAQTISEVSREHDLLYFAAIMNKGNLAAGTAGVWEGPFNDSGTPLDLPGGKVGILHDFAPDGGGDTHNDVVAASPFPTMLQWADPFGASGNDYDLCILDAEGNLECSVNVQDGDDDPIERVRPVQPGDRILIVKSAVAAARFLHLDTFGAGTFRSGVAQAVLEHGTDGSITGHAGSEDVIAVAAVNVNQGGSDSVDSFAALSTFQTNRRLGLFDANDMTEPFDGTETVEDFSSDGPRRVFFDADGNPFSQGQFNEGVVRQKPDIAAADGISTSTPGFESFFGTSASAPHAAGIAALFKEALNNTNNGTGNLIDDFSVPQDPLSGSAGFDDIFTSNETNFSGGKRLVDIFISGNGSQGAADISNGSFNVSFEIGPNGLGSSAVCYEKPLDLTNGGKNDTVKIKLKTEIQGEIEVTLFVNDVEGFSSAHKIVTSADGRELAFKLSDFQSFGQAADLSKLEKFGVSLAALNPGKSEIAIDEVATTSSTGSGSGSEPNSVGEIREALFTSATDIGVFGTDTTSGSGLIDALNFLGNIPPESSVVIPIIVDVDLDANDVPVSFGANDQPVRSNIKITGTGTGNATAGVYTSSTDAVNEGDPVSMAAFVDLFYDVTFTDVDPNADYDPDLPTTVVIPSVSSSLTTSFTGLADPTVPNFGILGQNRGWDWLRDTSIPIGDGKTLFIPSTRLRTRLQLQFPDPNTEIFTDGFETGDTSSWTSSPPFEVNTLGTLTIKETQVVAPRSNGR